MSVAKSEYSISRGLSVCGSGDRYHLHLSRGLNATSLDVEQATALRAHLDTWLFEYWQLTVADREVQ